MQGVIDDVVKRFCIPGQAKISMGESGPNELHQAYFMLIPGVNDADSMVALLPYRGKEFIGVKARHSKIAKHYIRENPFEKGACFIKGSAKTDEMLAAGKDFLEKGEMSLEMINYKDRIFFGISH